MKGILFIQYHRVFGGQNALLFIQLVRAIQTYLLHLRNLYLISACYARLQSIFYGSYENKSYFVV